MKSTIITLALLLSSIIGYSQKYITKEGSVKIHSETSLFTIEAENKKVASILDKSNGDLVASTLVRSFKFKEALVEEHFNENYIESHLYPKSMFKGKITNIESVNFDADGTYDIQIEGDLTMHGETNPINAAGQIIVKDGIPTGKCVINISLAQYKIKIEESYKDRINDSIELTIEFNYAPYTK